MTNIKNKLTKRLFFFSGVLLLVINPFTSCVSNQDDFSGILGTKAPSFSLLSIDGNRVHLFDYKDKVIVLFFFGNNCKECKAEVPVFEKYLVNPYVGCNDYVVLGLDYWNGAPAVVRAFKDETGIDIPLLLDAGNVGANYRIAYNRIVVIDRDQKIIFSGTQEASRDIVVVKGQIDNLLKIK